MFAYFLVAICVLFGAVGQVLMRKGMSQIGPIGGLSSLLTLDTLLMIFTNIFVLMGLVLYAVSAVLWLAALSSLNVSLIYPLLSTAYIIAAILSAIFLKENVTLLRWLGIFTVIVGSYLIVRS